MNYAVSIVATTVACTVVVMLCSGGKHEKLCTSVSLALIALSALLPLRSIVNGDIGAELKGVVESAREQSDAAVAEACVNELEERVASAVEERFSGCRVESVTVSCDAADLRNIKIEGCGIRLCGADPDGVRRYVSELLSCGKTDVIMIGGDLNGYQKDP